MTDPTALEQPLVVLYLLGDIVSGFNSTESDAEDATFIAEVAKS